jgi:hypothetical protein
MYKQVGIDVFHRLRELNKSKPLGDIVMDENY